MKTAIIVLSDPKGGEEALGRVFNALAVAFDFKERQQDVELVFQGTGTRWAGVLGQPDHPVHALYESVKDKIVGVSSACSLVFGARDDAEKNGFALVDGNAVPGTPGLPSIARYANDGWTVLTF